MLADKNTIKGNTKQELKEALNSMIDEMDAQNFTDFKVRLNIEVHLIENDEDDDEDDDNDDNKRGLEADDAEDD